MKDKYIALFSSYKNIYEGVVLSDVLPIQPGKYITKEIYLDEENMSLIKSKVLYLNRDILYAGVYETTLIDNAEVVFIATHFYNENTQSFESVSDRPYISDASII